jgi:hypothetical protein
MAVQVSKNAQPISFATSRWAITIAGNTLSVMIRPRGVRSP